MLLCPPPTRSRIGSIAPHPALAAAVLACIVPALLPIHTLPIPSFYEEWVAAALAAVTLAIVFAQSRGKVVQAPMSAWPLGAFALVLVAQVALAKLAYVQQAILAMLYVLLTIAMIWCGMRLRDTLGMDRAARGVAHALLVAGVLSATIALVQGYAPPTTFGSMIAPLDSPRVFANLGQPNLLANQLAVAGASLLYLWASGAIGKRTAFLLGTLLIAALSLTGSRSVWLYGAALLVWTMFHRQRSGEAKFMELSVAIVAALIGLALIASLLPPVAFDGATRSANSAFERLAAMRVEGASAGDGLRAYFWQHAAAVAQNEPWLGTGIGRFAASFIDWPPDVPAALHPVERNAHNIWLHLLAETGVFGMLCVLGALTMWFVRVLCGSADLTRWWLVACVGVMLLHSQLEYPLWYAHFLVPFALLLGLGETGIALRTPRLARVIAIAAMAGGAVALASLLHGYIELRNGVYLATESDLRDDRFLARQHETIRRVQASLLAPYVDLPLAGTLPIDAEALEEKLALNARVMRIAPIPPIVLRHVVFLTLAGHHDEAQRLFETAARLYPRELPAFAADLDRLRIRGLAMDRLATYVAARGGNN